MCSLTYDVNQFMAMFFAIGFGLGGFESNVYVYINEISANRFRAISANVIVISWAAG